MARLNTKPKLMTAATYEGAPARVDRPEKELRRAVLSCLLWEDQFYESGVDIAARITALALDLRCNPEVVAALAVEARTKFNLRHVPLLLIDPLSRRLSGASNAALVAQTVAQVVQRVDDAAELLAVYWRNGRKTVPAQVRRGLATALMTFNEYQLAKYDRDGKVKLRDVFRLARPKPLNDEQSALWKRVVSRTLETPDTWEVALTRGADKKETFTRLLEEKKLGYLALLRNLRNMHQSGVDEGLIKRALLARRGAERVFPFRYVAAARACPPLEPIIDAALCAAIKELPELPGKTVVLVDVSGSMDEKLSGKSDLKRIDAAAALASIIHGDLRVFTFSNTVQEVPPRRGMAGVDAVIKSQPHQSTFLGAALRTLNANTPHDRLIVITDEQSHDAVPPPAVKRAYMINVAGYQPSVAYDSWVRIEGFSENVIRYIYELENDAALQGGR